MIDYSQLQNDGHKKRRIVRSERKPYWWVCAIEKASGRPIVQGPHNTDSEARQWGVENIRDNDWEVLSFPTVNKEMARDMYKSKVLERTKDLSSVFKRARYP